jgi:DNA-binding response OmpR family regulator
MSLFEAVQRATVALARFERLKQDKDPQILVVDDDAVHRTIICKIAARAGFVSVEAKDCGEVVRATLLNDFHCTTLDLSLGEREGTEVLLHFSICGFKAPVIILSGAETEVATKAYALGKSLNLNMVEPIAKPVDLGLLRQRLTVIAEQWRAHRVEATAA